MFTFLESTVTPDVGIGINHLLPVFGLPWLFITSCRIVSNFSDSTTGLKRVDYEKKCIKNIVPSVSIMQVPKD